MERRRIQLNPGLNTAIGRLVKTVAGDSRLIVPLYSPDFGAIVKTSSRTGNQRERQRGVRRLGSGRLGSIPEDYMQTTVALDDEGHFTFPPSEGFKIDIQRELQKLERVLDPSGEPTLAAPEQLLHLPTVAEWTPSAIGESSEENPPNQARNFHCLSQSYQGVPFRRRRRRHQRSCTCNLPGCWRVWVQRKAEVKVPGFQMLFTVTKGVSLIMILEQIEDGYGEDAEAKAEDDEKMKMKLAVT
ncbi:unnamed protein product [Linum tenue]|uniref:Uncharacterized protein n=1 Tax=Linum tenue TaxID=586396 RepID=A0AAV0NXA6_9ROSI|nr:unnamed protein product [Linum tenue]